MLSKAQFGVLKKVNQVLEAEWKSEEHLVAEVERTWGALETLARQHPAPHDHPLRNQPNPVLAILAEIRAVIVAELEEERLLAERLGAAWPQLFGAIQRSAREFEELRAKLPADDPALLPVDLLGLIGEERKEVLHTRVLRSLIDPRVAGILAIDLLAELVMLVEGDLEISRERLAMAEVDEPRLSDDCYPDLRVTIQLQVRRFLLVIENKIDAIDHEGQLDRYAEAANDEAGRGDIVWLVYLTPEGAPPTHAEEPEAWTRLSYRALALAWRAVLARHESDTGLADIWAFVLRLYLATLVQHIAETDLKSPPSLTACAKLVPYLRSTQQDSSTRPHGGAQ